MKINKDKDLENYLIIYLLYILFKIHQEVKGLKRRLLLLLSEAQSSAQALCVWNISSKFKKKFKKL